MEETRWRTAGRQYGRRALVLRHWGDERSRPSLATASGDAADQRLLVIESLALGAPSFAKSQDVNMIVSLSEHACTGHFSVPHGSTPHRSETTVGSDGGNRSTWALPVPAGSAPRVPLGRVATAPTDDSLIARIDILVDDHSDVDIV